MGLHDGVVAQGTVLLSGLLLLSSKGLGLEPTQAPGVTSGAL